ncbi:hypothetical protein MMC17_002747 [Xylographa soralifera]|nr:hypothetical protein [Xylographa soralifera]
MVVGSSHLEVVTVVLTFRTMRPTNRLDAIQKPSQELRTVFKKYQKISIGTLDKDSDVIDFVRSSVLTHDNSIRVVRTITSPILSESFTAPISNTTDTTVSSFVKVFEHCDFPGLEIIPNLLPCKVQQNLLSQLLHRGLANPQHKTNIHTHYHVPYELSRSNPDKRPSTGSQPSEDDTSFFNCDPQCLHTFSPVSPKEHKPITITQFLCKKLRWITLGGQYDWTQKVYPQQTPPAFPWDIGNLVHGLFPDMAPEAAIVNIYSPGDTLSLHRDVSEDSDQGLVSISLGCDGLFVVGMRDETDARARSITLRLRSGDAVYMSGPSRYAWHGVPRIISGTCPKWLQSWPASLEEPEEAGGIERASNGREAWRGWMATKRINLNVRQMKD